MTVTLVGPALAAILALGGWMTAQTRDEHGLPRRALVALGQAMAAFGLLLGVLTVPQALPPLAYAMALAATLVVGLLLVRGAGRLSIGWTSAAEVITSAVGLSWRRPRRAAWSLLCAAAGLTLAVWLAGRGEAAAALLGAATVLAPARWWLAKGAARERARTGVERAMAGVMAGGVEWDTNEAAQRGAPVCARFEGDATPVQIMAPLPPSWKASTEEALSREINSRLAEWGTPWIAAVNHSQRRLVVTKGEDLPEMVRYAGERPAGMRLPLGICRISPAAALAGVGRLGTTVPFYWDAADSPSGLIVGSMGGGKSVLVRLIVAQWAGSIGPVYLLDPKRVEFSIFAGRKNVEVVATSLEQITGVFARAEAEMDRRYALMEKASVQHVKDLPEVLQPILIVCDEFFELVAKNPGSDDHTKAENELRAQCASSARSLAALGRAAGIHEVLLAQRADAEIVKGSLQNNLLFRALLRPLSAGATARNMIGLQDVEASGNPRGRAVMKSALWPECEVQTFYLDAADLAHYLPKAKREQTSSDGGQPLTDGEADAAETAAEPKPKSGALPSHDRDRDQDRIEGKADQESGERPAPKSDQAEPETEDVPSADLSIDPLDFFGDD